MKVVDNLKNIEEKINIACENSGRDREAIKLITVTKYVSVERANEALKQEYLIWAKTVTGAIG